VRRGPDIKSGRGRRPRAGWGLGHPGKVKNAGWQPALRSERRLVALGGAAIEHGRLLRWRVNVAQEDYVGDDVVANDG
jgi:hypothetical protein